MSRTEDYLDELLHSVSKKDDTEADAQASGKKRNKPRTEEDDFLSAFEQEILAGEDSDEFLQQFEKELDLGGRGFDTTVAAEENMESMQPPNMDPEPVPEVPVEQEDMPGADDIMGSSDIPENLDDILSGAKEKMEEPPLIRVPDEAESQDGLEIPDMDGFADAGDGAPVPENTGDGMDIMIDTMGDIPDGSEETDLGGDSDLERRLGDIADATENLSSISELGDEFGLDEFDEEQAAMEENTVEAAEVPEEEADGKKKKKSRKERKLEKQKAKEAGKNPDGEQEMTFLQKLSKIIFGEDEEEEEEPVKKKAAKKKDNGESEGEGEGGDAGDSAEAADGKGKKEKKKKEKKPKEKKPKEKKPKKEKKKKEKKPKPPKPKKEKKPKEPDNTPPLPRVPVILIFIMAGSILALVLLGTNLVGYTNQFADAKRYYELGNYTEAYRAVRGMEIKEKDLDTFEKYRILATVAGEYDSYQSFMESALYEMALDSLVRAVGRSEKYHEDAVLYECAGELEQVEEQAVMALSGFGLDKTRALDLYSIREKSEYSIEVHDILINAGLVTEE